jgi:hypothetical protein
MLGIVPLDVTLHFNSFTSLARLDHFLPASFHTRSQVTWPKEYLSNDIREALIIWVIFQFVSTQAQPVWHFLFSANVLTN